MSLKKTIIMSALCGLSLSGLGLLLAVMGGYGPCGPASPMAEVGAYLSVFHAVALFTIFPFLEDCLIRLQSGPANAAALFLIPAVDWTVIVFVLLTCGRIINRVLQKPDDENIEHPF